VVSAGLAALTTLLALTLLWSPDTAPIWLAIWFFGFALAMGWVIAPGTDAVVGAVPAARSGVASAMNTVGRLVAGALGVAVIGSLINSLYSGDLERSVGALPPQPQHAATESVGGASALAAQLPARAGAGLLSAAGDAFVDAMAVGMAVVAAGLCVLTAVVVARLLPSSPDPAGRDHHDDGPVRSVDLSEVLQ
jgi:MFS transporter, DHA2 family, multidrug resistance protein